MAFWCHLPAPAPATHAELCGSRSLKGGLGPLPDRGQRAYKNGPFGTHSILLSGGLRDKMWKSKVDNDLDVGGKTTCTVE